MTTKVINEFEFTHVSMGLDGVTVGGKINASIGLTENETCNRNGCTGIIIRHEREGCCSCHINPPCSYCTDAEYYCNECGWDERDEVKPKTQNQINNYDTFEFKKRTLKDLDRTRIDYLLSYNGYYGMVKEGYVPAGISVEELKKNIDGSFGGRFDLYPTKENDMHYIYVAYTD